MPTNQIDNRRHPRLAVGCDVQIQPIGALFNDQAPRSHFALSRDISDGGMRLSADRRYPLHAQLLLAFEHEESGWDCVTSCMGAVVWTTPLPGSDGCLMGIEFGEQDISGATRLQ